MRRFSGCAVADNLCEPFAACKRESHVDDERVQHKLPSFFGRKEWDLSSRAGHTASTVVMIDSFNGKNWDDKECSSFYNASTKIMERHLEFSLQAGDRFGIELQETSNGSLKSLLTVSHIDGESAFSRTTAGTRGIREGDAIVAVNGQNGSASDLREAVVRMFSASGNRVIKLVVHPRLPAFNAELRRGFGNQEKLGLSVVPCKSMPGCLLIKNVRAKGAAQAWNAAHGSKRICSGDLITHVNGISHNVQRMKNAMKDGFVEGSRVRLCILTPSDELSFHGEDGFLDTVSEESTSASSSLRSTQSS